MPRAVLPESSLAASLPGTEDIVPLTAARHTERQGDQPAMHKMVPIIGLCTRDRITGS